ncbi:DNA polymerase I, partial [Akkermansiaceae bacterium]|nr:DNA polymerase I [Akkermansiaceae bacterium]
MAENRLFLLDGMALVYRAHFAFIRNPITNSQGVNTSAIYGFTNTLLTIIEKEAPTHLAVAFDTSAPTARHILYPEYKAQREAMPEELAAAIPEVKKVCAAFKIPVLVIDGFEADDIIGTVARRAEEAGGIETFMVTPDKDFAQLVAPHTAMWKPGRQGSDHEVLTYEKILKNWGISDPKQVIDILGLWGDASDNIPGVPGIGEKTAKKLVSQFGSVEGLLRNTDKLKGKQKENVTNFSDQARLSKELATIITDVPIEESFDDFKLEEPDEETLKSLFEIWEFRTLTKRLFGNTATATKPAITPVFENLKTLNDVPHKYHLIQSEKTLDSLIKELLAVDTFCFDVETNSLDRFSSKLLGIAFSHSPGEAFYLPLTGWPSLREKLLPVFQSPALKIGHNLKFDLAIMLSHGIQVAGPFFDTMLAHTLAAPEQKHSMDSLSENLLGYSPIKLVDLFSGEQNEEDDLFAAAAKKKASKGELDPSELPINILAEYAAEDADVTLQLYHKLLPELKKLNALPVMEDIESPLLPVLVAMENEGISMDQTVLDEVGKILTIKIK